MIVAVTTLDERRGFLPSLIMGRASLGIFGISATGFVLLGATVLAPHG